MTTSTSLAPADLIKAQGWRYATKKFDPTKKIPAELWSTLEQTLVLTPSSYGLQPWKFIVVTDAALKAKLRPADPPIAEVRGQAVESLAGYKSFMMGDLVKGPRSAVIGEWAARQVYIALGNFMTSAALLGVDTCPIEGLEPAKYDEILGLTGTGYRTVVACPAGYRSVEDKYASAPKVRYPAAELIDRR